MSIVILLFFEIFSYFKINAKFSLIFLLVAAEDGLRKLKKKEM